MQGHKSVSINLKELKSYKVHSLTTRAWNEKSLTEGNLGNSQIGKAIFFDPSIFRRNQRRNHKKNLENISRCIKIRL